MVGNAVVYPFAPALLLALPIFSPPQHQMDENAHFSPSHFWQTVTPKMLNGSHKGGL